LAQGDILIFLNNDTLPLAGWLPPLLRILREKPEAGAVGGKLVYPDGTLQEAGGVIFADGSGCNFGRFDKASNAPLYNFVREVDYCSGALLATPRALFMELGGFDVRFKPAYYEDVDYCFTLREKGYRVYYQPESVIVHFEGTSSGTDLKTGVKSYQVVNQHKFVAKWSKVLKQHYPAPDQYDPFTLNTLSRRNEWANGDGN
jgi:GT2 family glycosyltransferase